MTRDRTGSDAALGSGTTKSRQVPETSARLGEAGHSAEDDLVDVGSEESFPASDPPSYMGGTAITGAPPHHGEPPREGVSRTLIRPDEAKPADDAPQGTDPAPARPGFGGNNP